MNSHYLFPLRQGLIKGFRITLLMAKIVIPITFIVVIMEKLGLLIYVADFFSPFLNIFGLPGEAALALFLGFFIHVYAAMGAIAALSLTPREITVIALMILTSHSLLMEAPILRFTGLNVIYSTLLRVGGALFFGYVLNNIYLFFGG